MSLLSANLEAFVAVARVKTVQGAAKELNLTQTGVTQRLRALEKQLSTTVFVRSRKGMALTAEGEALLRYCQAALDLEGATMARLHKNGVKEEVRVALTGPTSIVTSRVTRQLEGVLKKFPELLLSLKISDLLSRVDDLRTGLAQMAIVPHESVAREMDSKVLKPERYILVACRAWRLRGLREIIKAERLIDFDQTDDTSLQYLKKFKLSGENRQERHFVNNNESLIELIAGGAGYGVLTLEVAKPHLESGALTALNHGSALENPLALAWYPRPEMPAYFKAIIDAIK